MGSSRHRRRRETSRRVYARGSRSPRSGSRPSREASQQREYSQVRLNKRRRRKSSSISSSSVNDNDTGSGTTNVVKHGSIPSTQTQLTGLSFHDVIELIKSLPSSTSQTQNHFNMSMNAVPEFDPANKEQTVDLWISKVDECAKLYKWSEMQLLHYALPKLAGVAKVWYQGLPSLNFSWLEWKEKLSKTFPTVQNYAQLLHEMLERKVRHNESLETYFYHKLSLLNRCDITGKRAVDCLIYGLEDKGMRLGAQAANYSQPEDLLSYFKSIKIEDAKDRTTRPIFSKPNSILPSNIKCFNCNEVGHPSFKCTKPLISCDICKRLGHQSVHCRRLTRDNLAGNFASDDGAVTANVD